MTNIHAHGGIRIQTSVMLKGDVDHYTIAALSSNKFYRCKCNFNDFPLFVSYTCLYVLCNVCIPSKHSQWTCAIQLNKYMHPLTSASRRPPDNYISANLFMMLGHFTNSLKNYIYITANLNYTI